MPSNFHARVHLTSPQTSASSAPAGGCTNCQQGMTLIELMVAMTLGMLVLGVVAVIFSGTSGNRAGLERGGRLAENAAYSVEVLSDEIRMAGFLSSVRAIATRCFSPPDSFRPRSPTIVA